MNKNIFYKNKYLKYKNKYIQLGGSIKQLIGYANKENIDTINTFEAFFIELYKNLFEKNNLHILWQLFFLNEAKTEDALKNSIKHFIYLYFEENNTYNKFEYLKTNIMMPITNLSVFPEQIKITKYTNYLQENIYLSALPKDCNTLSNISSILGAKVAIISLREDIEPYIKCSTLGSLESINFRIPDFGNITADVYLELIDNCTQITKSHTLFIHCLGGHGRTGTVAIGIIALQIIKAYSTEIKNNFKTPISIKEGLHNISALAIIIFSLAQCIVITSFYMYRETDSKKFRPDIKNIIAPETHGQKNMCLEAIEKAIKRVILAHTENITECSKPTNDLFASHNLWPCPKYNPQGVPGEI
jgi:protein tyrosine phosphatase